MPLPAGASRRFGDSRFRVTGVPVASTLSADGKRLAVLSSVYGREAVVLLVLDAASGAPLVRTGVGAQGGVYAALYHDWAAGTKTV